MRDRGMPSLALASCPESGDVCKNHRCHPTAVWLVAERGNGDGETEIHSFVTTFAEPTLAVLGVVIETISTTTVKADDGTVLSCTEIFDQAVVDSPVAAFGSETGVNVILADEAKIEHGG